LIIFILSLFSLFAGGMMTWYFFYRNNIPDTSRPERMVREDIIPAGLEVASPESVPAGNGGYHEAEQPPESINESRKNAIVMAAERVGRAVVSINVLQTQVVRRRNGLFPDDFWNEFFSPRSYKREVQSLGSGFILSDEGYIITNEHVVRGGEDITVILEDGREFKAALVGSDALADIAVLRIDADDLPLSAMGTSSDLMIGEWVIAIGNPFGYLLDDTQPTVTVGVVSAVKRDIKVAAGYESVYADMIQTDASINPGNSGGPLVNSRGEVVGVNTFIFTKSGGSIGIGFAIPVDRARRVSRDIISYGKVLRPWVGIHPQDLTPSLRRGLNLEDQDGRDGVIVADVDKGSPADHAGMGRGDVIARINGKTIRSAQDWEGILLDVRVEDTLSLKVFRDGSFKNVAFATDPLPTDTVEKTEVNFGIVLSDITESVKSQLGLRSNQGALIIEVEDPQLSRDSGLESHDVILKVNDTDIRSAEEAKKVLEGLSRRRNSIVLERNGRLVYRSLLIG